MIKISRKKDKKNKIYTPSSLQLRLDNLGWTKKKSKNLNIIIEEISTGNVKIFAYLWQLENFIVSLEKERSNDGDLDGE